MASNNADVPLPEPLSSLLGACGSAPLSTPLPRDNCESGSESDISDVHMGSAGSGDEEFSLVNGKRAKRKRKLAAACQSPASPTQVADHGNSGLQSANLASSTTKPDPTTLKFPPIIIPDNRNYTQLYCCSSFCPSFDVRRCEMLRQIVEAGRQNHY